MNHYLDLSNATVFANTEAELIHLANEYAISLARDCDFFKGTHTDLITDPLSLKSTDSLDNLSSVCTKSSDICLFFVQLSM